MLTGTLDIATDEPQPFVIIVSNGSGTLMKQFLRQIKSAKGKEKVM